MFLICCIVFFYVSEWLMISDEMLLLFPPRSACELVFACFEHHRIINFCILLLQKIEFSGLKAKNVYRSHPYLKDIF